MEGGGKGRKGKGDEKGRRRGHTMTHSHTPSSLVSSAFFQADKFGRPGENGVTGDLRSLSPHDISFQPNLFLSHLFNSSHSSLVSAALVSTLGREVIISTSRGITSWTCLCMMM